MDEHHLLIVIYSRFRTWSLKDWNIFYKLNRQMRDSIDLFRKMYEFADRYLWLKGKNRDFLFHLFAHNVESRLILSPNYVINPLYNSGDLEKLRYIKLAFITNSKPIKQNIAASDLHKNNVFHYALRIQNLMFSCTYKPTINRSFWVFKIFQCTATYTRDKNGKYIDKPHSFLIGLDKNTDIIISYYYLMAIKSNLYTFDDVCYYLILQSYRSFIQNPKSKFDQNIYSFWIGERLIHTLLKNDLLKELNKPELQESFIDESLLNKAIDLLFDKNQT